MSDFLSQIRKWLGLDESRKVEQIPEEDIARAEDEGMSPPDVETPLTETPK